MENLMNKRVYGIIGISSIMSNWNADFSGYPKSLSDGRVYGSDKALKYTMKKMWEAAGKNILYIKSMKFSEKDGSLIPKSLSERYGELFGNLKAASGVKEVATNLLKATDVKHFGATFAESKNNISITGAVQFGQGLNKYEETQAEEQNILSPFRDSSKDGDGEAKNSTLGTKIVSDEAHYFYPFVINPSAYRNYEKLGVTDGYTEEDYAEFKEAALSSVTAYASNSKEGCSNEFAIFVETDENLYLPNLTEYLSFEKKGESKIIHLENLITVLLSVKDRIKAVEVYYEPHSIIVNIPEERTMLKKFIIKDIISKKEKY